MKKCLLILVVLGAVSCFRHRKKNHVTTIEKSDSELVSVPSIRNLETRLVDDWSLNRRKNLMVFKYFKPVFFVNKLNTVYARNEYMNLKDSVILYVNVVEKIDSLILKETELGNKKMIDELLELDLKNKYDLSYSTDKEIVEFF